MKILPERTPTQKVTAALHLATAALSLYIALRQAIREYRREEAAEDMNTFNPSANLGPRRPRGRAANRQPGENS